MPIYDYECQQCKEVFEYLKMDPEDNRINCPKCSSNLLKRVYHGRVSIARARDLVPPDSYKRNREWGEQKGTNI